MSASTASSAPTETGPAEPASPSGPGLARDERGQTSNLSGLIVGIAVAAIIGIGVGIPIVNDVTATANLSGITATVVGFIPIMLALLIFVATASPIMRRT